MSASASGSEPGRGDINDVDARTPESWVRRVRIRNFRSIAYCDVELRPFTVLVGGNGSGKSNLVEALAFIKNLIKFSFRFASLGRVHSATCFYLGAKSSETLEIEMDLDLSGGQTATYGLELAYPTSGWHRVREWLTVARGGQILFKYRVEGGTLTERQPATSESWPYVPADGPYLTQIADRPHARDVFLFFNGIEFYDFDPRLIRILPSPGRDRVLDHTASNLADMLARIGRESEQVLLDRVEAYLRLIDPTIERVGVMSIETRVQPLDGTSFLCFEKTIGGKSHTLSATMISDGTLRALACLVAVAQQARDEPPLELIPIRVVAIEEPETAIHPASVAILADAFDEATLDKQVIITTHSPDLLDNVDFDKHRVLAVEMTPEGTTIISPIDWASRESIREKLYTPGELHRMGHISTDWRDVERQKRDAGQPAGVVKAESV
jgi:predicted ATPase